jgi:hypothetical protein
LSDVTVFAGAPFVSSIHARRSLTVEIIVKQSLRIGARALQTAQA